MRKTLFAFLFLSSTLLAQISLTTTTLSAPVNANPALQNFVQLSSNTGVVPQGILYVDREAMQVVSIAPITNTVTVFRGQLGTSANAHASGASVFVGTPSQFFSYDPSGACVATLTAVTPWINVLNGNQWTCSAGAWTLSGGTSGGVIPSSATVTFGGTTYTGYSFGASSFPPRINGITGAGNYPPFPATGYGYAAIDVGPALFTAPAPSVPGTSSRSIMGINSAIATAFPDSPVNVFAINGQIATPSTYNGNQWAWYGMYHENDHNGSGTLHLAYSTFGADYNSGNGTCSACIGGHFEAVGNFYGGAFTPTTVQNTGLECNSGANTGAIHTLDYCFRVMTPFTGGTFTNGHIGIQIDDQTNGGALPIGSVYAIRVGAGNATPVGNLDWGANKQFIESTTSGSLQFNAPTGAIGSVQLNWPIATGTITETIGSGTSTTNGTAVATLTCQAQPTITITGATTTDVAHCSLNGAAPATWQTGITMLPPEVTSNTVTYRLCNPTATANITPAATVVRCTVTR